jgi:hypothetical protein
MKFLNSAATRCVYCAGRLLPRDILRNDEHIWNPGILYECHCRGSRIWGNSLRGPIEALISYIETEVSHYIQGFSNFSYRAISGSNSFLAR